jgi:hypothetical protein
MAKPGTPTVPSIVGQAVTARLKHYPAPAVRVTPLIASEARKCSRAIGFRLFGTPKNIPLTPEDLRRMREGDHYHQITQEELARTCNARSEIPFDHLPAAPVGGKGDAGWRLTDGRKAWVEIKSVSHNAWARHVGLYQGVPCGPRIENLVQGGLGALAPKVNAELLHIIYVDVETDDVAEWLIGLDEQLSHLEVIGVDDNGEPQYPTIRTVVADELDRLTRILALCEAGTLPERVVPGFGPVNEPPAADAGYADPWNCKFCPWQPTCAALPVGQVAEFGEMAA